MGAVNAQFKGDAAKDPNVILEANFGDATKFAHLKSVVDSNSTAKDKINAILSQNIDDLSPDAFWADSDPKNWIKAQLSDD